MIYITGNSFMQIIGIHWDQPHFRTAHLRANRQEIEILALEDVKQLYKFNFRGKVTTGISGKDLLIRNVTLKIKKHRHLREALRFQSETTSHLAPEEILSAALLHENKKEKITEATVVTVLRNVIKTHLTLYESFGITPDRVSAIPQALLRYALWKNPSLEQGFLIDLGSSEWSCIWIENKRLKKSFSLTGGVEDLLSALWEDRKKTLLHKEVEGVGRQIDLLQLKPELNPHLHKKIIEKRQEIAKVIYSFSQHSVPCPIFFTGRTDAFVHIREYLIESVQELIVAEKKLPPPSEEHKYAISIGLGLEETVPSRDSLQFLQDEFFPKKNWRKTGFFSLLLLILSLLSSGFLTFWSQHNYNQKGQALVQSIEQLLSQYDPELKNELLENKEFPKKIIQSWVAAIRKNEQNASYLQPPPKVSELFYWISQHPLLKTFSEAGDPIEWKDIRYRLVKFPKIGSAQEIYQAQVDLEFHLKNPTNARKFHEALLKGDEWICAEEGIGWESVSAGYKASFFLKQRKKHVF